MNKTQDEWFNKYVGIPYKEGGRKPFDGGLDCYGLVRYVLHNEMGILLPELGHIYWKTDNSNRLEVIHAIRDFDKIKYNFHPIKLEEMKAFNVLILNVGGPFHIGIAVDEHRFLHTEDEVDSCVESVRYLRWKSRVHSCWCFHQPCKESV